MSAVYKVGLVLLGLPNTLRFNFRYLPWRQAIGLPIVVSHRVWLDRLDGRLVLREKHRAIGMIRIGFGSVGIFDRQKRRSVWRNDGTVIFEGKARLNHGTRLSVDDGATVVFGREFVIAAEATIASRKGIRFGDDVLVSWDVQIMDTDWHELTTHEGVRLNPDREVIVGNHVWIGSRVLVLKGARIADGSVVAAGAVVTRAFNEGNVVLGGVPAREIRHNISWRRGA